MEFVLPASVSVRCDRADEDPSVERCPVLATTRDGLPSQQTHTFISTAVITSLEKNESICRSLESIAGISVRSTHQS
jgi:hypothetical protein